MDRVAGRREVAAVSAGSSSSPFGSGVAASSDAEGDFELQPKKDMGER